MSSLGSEANHGGPPDVLPASQYLQERLQERRARNTRPKRVRQSDFGPRRGRDDDIFLAEADDIHHTRLYDSSPLAAMSAKGSDSGHGSSNRRRMMGIRDMDGELDRLNKQNFALKLEIDHRRDHAQKMQEQLDSMRELIDRAERLETEHAELLRINSQLVNELEKRDKAVEEAMDIICDLEEQNNELVERNSNTRPSTAHADSGYAGTEMPEHDSPSSRPGADTRPKSPTINVRQPSLPASAASKKLQGLLNDQTPARARREPNILSEQKPSTHALRSVYMENAKQLHSVKSFQSLLSRQENKLDEDLDDALNSPRLSVLSESSFPSIYSPKQQLSPDRFAWEDAIDDDTASPSIRTRSQPRQDSIKRVSQWISERDAAETTPSKSNHISSPLQLKMDEDMPPPPMPRHAALQSHYHSLNNALSEVAVCSPEFLRQPHRLDLHEPSGAQRRKLESSRPRPMSLIGPTPGSPLLPPTPDSVSTRMLRASRSSIIGERSLLDITPAVVRGFDALEPGIRTAPKQMRSSVELSSAYNSNVGHRHSIAAHGIGVDESSEDEDFGEADRLSASACDFGIEYDGFPDGKSIKMGTPSRFFKHPQPPDMFNLNNMSPPQAAKVNIPSPRRRRSSDQIYSSLTKPRMVRVETSPTLLGTLGRMVSGGGKASAESIATPRSTRSGSSGNRTIHPSEQQLGAISPDVVHARQVLTQSLASPSPSRTAASPARTFGQKTQNLFRRLSNSQGSDREGREKSPLPTLTQSPASVYADNIPIELRRPMTSNTDRTTRTTATGPSDHRVPSSRDLERPSLQARTFTEPGNARPPSASGITAAEREKRNIFKRSNSLKKAAPEAGVAPETRRRGSIREVVSTARRPWR
ncbi:uncharacterized protein RCC_11307 [Ramularia collo-cygni]|uniref:Centrosomin N-terminal motif 1 domain-containing protein n=1 Tax=Ramularia collo-cygni TaxID=112498 RepID=A0A2D3VQK1_9PEZI|nr:uncharacterized protein RCC_11307 [Ramularia collo-cygni]CZT25639.1 uncharacterized protein RCC_11307 [Ramularia collo-cygni]